jgi:hypothetical protein
LTTCPQFTDDVLKALKIHRPEWNFRTLVRNEKNFDIIRALGTDIVHGSSADHALIEDEVSKADIVVNCLDADDLIYINAILAGARKHAAAGGKKTIFIHTSGSAVINDGTKDGRHNPSGKVWNVRVFSYSLIRFV